MTEANNKENITLVINTIKVAGYLFIVLGVSALVLPEKVEALMGLDLSTARIFGGSLIFVGFLDLFIVPKILMNTMKQSK